MARIALTIRATNACLYGEKEGLRDFPRCCEGCDMRGNDAVCADVNPLSIRAAEAICKVAGGIAFLTDSDEVDYRHVNRAIKLAIGHRLKLSRESCEAHHSHDVEMIAKWLDHIAGYALCIQKELNNLELSEIPAHLEQINKIKKSRNPLLLEEMDNVYRAWNERGILEDAKEIIQLHNAAGNREKLNEELIALRFLQEGCHIDARAERIKKIEWMLEMLDKTQPAQSAKPAAKGKTVKADAKAPAKAAKTGTIPKSKK